MGPVGPVAPKTFPLGSLKLEAVTIPVNDPCPVDSKVTPVPTVIVPPTPIVKAALAVVVPIPTLLVVLIPVLFDCHTVRLLNTPAFASTH